MRPSFRHATLGILFPLLWVAASSHAKTASEVYEQAAKSTVVVENIDAQGKTQSMGSGVVLTGGEVVTNCHVVKAANRLKVRIGEQAYPATLRYSDWDRDVCSLSSAGLNAPAAVVGSSKTLKVGAKVYAIGAPKGLRLTLSDGIVSSLRPVDGGHYIQTTAAISPGSSGGGLFDENGALVGLTTFYLAEGQNLNFAVPIEWVKDLAQRSTKAAATAQSETQWLNKSIELENRKDWPTFLEHTLRWTKAQPDSDSAWFGLGSAYNKAGHTAKAIEAYQKALRINPEFDIAWAMLGNAYGRDSQTAKAIEAYQQALRINPEFADAWYNLGNAYGRDSQTAKAIEAYQNALRINPDAADVWLNLGIDYDNAGQTAKAIDAVQQALRINPEFADAWFSLGNAYVRDGQSTKGIQAYQQTLRINPDAADAWLNLGIAYSRSGQRGKVLEVYKRLKTLDPERAERFFTKVVMP